MTPIIFIIYLTLLGLFIGSFLNVVAIRIPKGESIVSPPSHCSSCNHRLGVLDLIPVLSYLFLRGRCRYCGVKVSWIYPLGELVTALLFLLMYQQLGLQWELILALTLVSILVAITLSDLLYQIIPDKVVFFGMGVFLLFRIFHHPLLLWDYPIGFLVGGGIFYLLALISNGGMGGGDIKLMAMLGLVLGWKMTLLTIFIAATIGAVVGGILILTGKVKRKEPIPFGPFIALAAILVYLWGDGIIQAYVSMLQ